MHTHEGDARQGEERRRGEPQTGVALEKGEASVPQGETAEGWGVRRSQNFSPASSYAPAS
jgi:hypothetical protein